PRSKLALIRALCTYVKAVIPAAPRHEMASIETGHQLLAVERPVFWWTVPEEAPHRAKSVGLDGAKRATRFHGLAEILKAAQPPRFAALPVGIRKQQQPAASQQMDAPSPQQRTTGKQPSQLLAAFSASNKDLMPRAAQRQQRPIATAGTKTSATPATTTATKTHATFKEQRPLPHHNNSSNNKGPRPQPATTQQPRTMPQQEQTATKGPMPQQPQTAAAQQRPQHQSRCLAIAASASGAAAASHRSSAAALFRQCNDLARHSANRYKQQQQLPGPQRAKSTINMLDDPRAVLDAARGRTSTSNLTTPTRPRPEPPVDSLLFVRIISTFISLSLISRQPPQSHHSDDAPKPLTQQYVLGFFCQAGSELVLDSQPHRLVLTATRPALARHLMNLPPPPKPIEDRALSLASRHPPPPHAGCSSSYAPSAAEASYKTAQRATAPPPQQQQQQHSSQQPASSNNTHLDRLNRLAEMRADCANLKTSSTDWHFWTADDRTQARLSCRSEVLARASRARRGQIEEEALLDCAFVRLRETVESKSPPVGKPRTRPNGVSAPPRPPQRQREYSRVKRTRGGAPSRRIRQHEEWLRDQQRPPAASADYSGAAEWTMTMNRPRRLHSEDEEKPGQAVAEREREEQRPEEQEREASERGQNDEEAAARAPRVRRDAELAAARRRSGAFRRLPSRSRGGSSGSRRQMEAGMAAAKMNERMRRFAELEAQATYSGSSLEGGSREQEELKDRPTALRGATAGRSDEPPRRRRRPKPSPLIRLLGRLSGYFDFLGPQQQRAAAAAGLCSNRRQEVYRDPLLRAPTVNNGRNVNGDAG
uniref:Rho-GAP domain-containing protein n=1 Tax=Macrostomum lignano TaxID=282301 RepID=A0A1I8FNB2_9PLAT